MEWVDQDLPAARSRVGLADLGEQGVQLGGGRRGGDPSPHAADDLGEMRSSVRRIARESEWDPDIDRVALRHRVVRVARMFDARRHYADYFERLCFELDLAPEDVRGCVELAAPHPVADHGDAA